MRATTRGAAALVLLTVARAALAHHAAHFDEARVIEARGVLTEVRWQNPHVVLHLRDSATGENWRLEGTSANALERWQIGRERLPLDVPVTARGPASRRDAHAMLVAVLEFADGGQLVLAPVVAEDLGLVSSTGSDHLFPPPARNAAAAVDRPTGLFRVWTPQGRPATVAPQALLTAQARERAASYDPLADDRALRCIAPGMPRILATRYPVEFVDHGDEIVMRLEEWDAERTIYLRPGAGPAIQDPSPFGVSFGRWEGETLAVFTTYIDAAFVDDSGTPQGRGLTVLERYSPQQDDARLDWTITVTDASTFTTPWVQRGHFAWEPGETVKPYACAPSIPRAATSTDP
jgi:hypothetical protein